MVIVPLSSPPLGRPSPGSVRIVASQRPILGYRGDISAGGLLGSGGASRAETLIASAPPTNVAAIHGVATSQLVRLVMRFPSPSGLRPGGGKGFQVLPIRQPNASSSSWKHRPTSRTPARFKVPLSMLTT